MTLVSVPVQQSQQSKPHLNIADMIKNFDKNRKGSGDVLNFPERPL